MVELAKVVLKKWVVIFTLESLANYKPKFLNRSIIRI